MASEEDIYIKNVPHNLKEDIKTIAENLGITMSQLLKPKLREIRDSYPPDLRIKRSKD